MSAFSLNWFPILMPMLSANACVTFTASSPYVSLKARVNPINAL